MIQSLSTAPQIGSRKPFRLSIKPFMYLVLIAALFGQPNGLFLLFPVYPWVVLALILFLVLLIIAKKVEQERWTIPRINLWWPTALFFLYSVLSLAYAPNRMFGVRILISMMTKVVLFAAIVDVCQEVRDVRRVLRIISFIGTAFSIQGLLLVAGVTLFHLQPVGYFGEMGVLSSGLNSNLELLFYGPLGFVRAGPIRIGGVLIPRCQAMFTEPGWFANFMGMSLFATLGYAALKATARKPMTRLMICLQIGALFLTFSTAAAFAIGVGFFVYMGIAAQGRHLRIMRRIFHLLLIIALAVSLGYLLFPTIVDSIYKVMWTEKFSAPQRYSSVDQRLDNYQAALDLFTQRPILGWGTNQMRIVAGGAGANNAFLTVAVELGIIGLVIYVAVIIAIAKTILVNARMVRTCSSRYMVLFTACVSGGMTALIAHSMLVDTNWNFFYWIGLALLYVNRRLLVRTKSSHAETVQL